jgi:hypothetical protein
LLVLPLASVCYSGMFLICYLRTVKVAEVTKIIIVDVITRFNMQPSDPSLVLVTASALPVPKVIVIVITFADSD